MPERVATNANSEDQPRITAAELVEVITKHPDWADLPVHMLNMTDDAVWLTEIGYDCFDVNEGPVLSLLAHAPAVPGGQPAPSYGAVLARAEAAERRADELLAEVEQLRGVETKLRGHLDAIGVAHQEAVSAKRELDAMRETEHDIDVRTIAALLESQEDGASMDECKHAFAEVRACFGDRIATLNARDAAAGGVRPNGDPFWEEQ